MKNILLVMSMITLIAMPVFAEDYISATDIQKVSLNDTFNDVSKKIGEPQQVLSKELTADGKEQVVWLYETIKPFKEQNKFQGLLTGYNTDAKATMSSLSTYRQKRAQNPPYLVIFMDGKVSKIKRQEIDPNTNKPVDVVVY